MSKTIRAGYKHSAAIQRKAERAMRRAAEIGGDPRNMHKVQAAVYDKPFGFPETEIVDGKRRWKL